MDLAFLGMSIIRPTKQTCTCGDAGRGGHHPPPLESRRLLSLR